MIFKKVLFVSLLFSIVGSVAQVNLQPGDKAPGIHITDYLQNVPKDKSLKNKFVVLEFWATWCAPCLALVPELNRIQDKYKSRDDIAFVSMTYEAPKLAEAILKRMEFKSMVVSDQSLQSHIDFGVGDKDGMSVPRTFLIDKQGLIYSVDNASDLDTLIDNFVSGKPLPVTNDAEELAKYMENNPTIQLQNTATQLIVNSRAICSLLEVTSDQGSEGRSGKIETGICFLMNLGLRDLLAEVWNVPAASISVPDELKKSKFSLLYKAEKKKTPEENLAAVRQYILDAMGYSYSSGKKQTDVYFLRVADEKKLVRTPPDGFDHFGLDGENLIAGGTLKQILDFLFREKNIHIVDETGLTESFEIFLKNGDDKKIIKGLQSYGFSLTKGQAELTEQRFTLKQ